MTVLRETVPTGAKPVGSNYFIMQQEPGASNENDGLSPYYQGGKRGPWKDLYFPGSHSGLNLCEAFLYVGAGTYGIPEDCVLSAHELTVSAFPGAKPILWNRSTDAALTLRGDGIVLEGLTIQGTECRYLVLMTGRMCVIKRCRFEGG